MKKQTLSLYYSNIFEKKLNLICFNIIEVALKFNKKRIK